MKVEKGSRVASTPLHLEKCPSVPSKAQKLPQKGPTSDEEAILCNFNLGPKDEENY